ncbi:MAG: hypothetical protein MI717_09555 [Spirochaetales bacterium]|nr:hypothetical protein [Spirochaetales bacterium]
MNLWVANQPFILAGAIVLLGYLIRRLGVLSADDGEALARIALNITLPAVILLNVPLVPIHLRDIALPLTSFASSALMATLAYHFFSKMKEGRGLAITASAGYNIGLFAIPLAGGLFGAEGIARFAFIDLGNAFAVFGLAYWLAGKTSPKVPEGQTFGPKATMKMLLSSLPFLSYLLAIGMNLTGLKAQGFPLQVLTIFAHMNKGASLLVLGLLLQFNVPKKILKTVLPALTLRYALGFTLALGVLFLTPFPLLDRMTLAGTLIMPVGLSIIPFAVRWGHERDTAAAMLYLGIPCSFILFWSIWLIGNTWG